MASPSRDPPPPRRPPTWYELILGSSSHALQLAFVEKDAAQRMEHQKMLLHVVFALDSVQ